ncbi:hypothetical protein CLIB1444_24S00320 [[Candida] jaroonii]|uniref:Uncharacterized protein n=1 Tax=[Candida] jaroonii TaxID=467808 RepID=A0ACA9YGL6_9ASCO|nr:hypothetical protein CLIB1444_24S00320 [[Candida] jaroonii]
MEISDNFAITWYQISSFSLTLDSPHSKLYLENVLKHNSKHEAAIGDLTEFVIIHNDTKAIKDLIVFIEANFDTKALSINMSFNLSWLYYQSGDLTTSQYHFNSILQSQSTNPYHWYLRSLIYGDFDGPITYALSLNPSNKLKFQIYLAANEVYKSKSPSVAIDYIKKGLQLPFNKFYYEKCYFKLIINYLSVDNVTEAWFYSNQSLILFPRSYNLLIVHCFILLKFGNKPLSSQILNDLLKFHQASYDHSPWFLLSLTTELQKDSFNYLETSLKKNPSYAPTWILIGSLYLNLNQLPDALAAYSQALRLGDDFIGGLGWDGLSCVYERCDNQLLDASDACSRSANCFKKLGANYNGIVETLMERSNYLLKANKEDQKIEFRNPIEMPMELILNLVKDLDDEKEENPGDAQQQQQQQQQQHQQSQVQPQIQVQPQSQIQTQQTPQPQNPQIQNPQTQTPQIQNPQVQNPQTQQTPQTQNPQIQTQPPQPQPQQPQAQQPPTQSQTQQPQNPPLPQPIQLPQLSQVQPPSVNATPQPQQPQMNGTPGRSPQYYYPYPMYQFMPGMPMQGMPPQPMQQGLQQNIQPPPGMVQMPMPPPQQPNGHQNGQSANGMAVQNGGVGFVPGYMPHPMYQSPPNQKSQVYWRQ